MIRFPRTALRAARNLLLGGAPATAAQPAEVLTVSASLLGIQMQDIAAERAPSALYQEARKSYSRRAVEGEK